ncbi:MAG: NAD(P)-binding domain-containing protein [Hymenobacteraceae bacterium]|nr:NAD(P)-binding domain-containing protein [Hymenobacteraceae bacterium]MDX5395320.1 NAD(P)-binding domain-containing protein [Hymenobacteraceae bacterium]MDX5442196.1 NAD(P)-binding domain-containing protein [Hymenobacteraceae bacterium]MDX5511356.1 NAD(P)-binding domain-containing protein [Hymenobacteraceae bacterium]
MAFSQISCLIIDPMHSSIIPLLEEIGIQVSYQPEIKPDQVKSALPGFQGLIMRSKINITPQILSEAKDLKFIARAGAGVDNIDQEVLDLHKITLLNAPEGNRDAVGEHTVGLLLSLLHKIAKADKEVRNRIWNREENRGEELNGKTVAIFGYGNMGRAFARRLSGFGCTVIAYDRSDKQTPDEFAQLVSIPEIFEKSDIVSLHIPYTPENYHFANEAFLRSFKKPIRLINTARGEVLDYEALVKLLKSGKVIGAALDVMENEKLHTLTEPQLQTFEYLMQSPVTVLTPHVAGWTQESYLKINQVLVSKIKHFIKTQENEC